MDHLIWIGNTLYPRWVVFTAVAAIPIGILLTAIIVNIIQFIRRRP
jgi:hypothetical protein